ncbi:ABC transporter permease [Bacteroides sp. OttesenSCG-928-D19]|nr:ABC transporter permease [Bacteroides sp. OttesenSCG-928-D19]
MKCNNMNNQMKQSPFFSIVSILSTAVTIAFVMVAYMAYDLNSADIAPEANRSRMLFSAAEQSFRTADNSNVNRAMAYKTAEAITANLANAESVSLHTENRPYNCQAVGGEGNRSRQRGRFVDRGWWNVFDYTFIAGRTFTPEEYVAGRPVVVITERLARDMFQSSEVVGREMLINYRTYTICGVVKNVSSQFSIAYADFWASYTAQPNILTWGNGSENVAGTTRFIAVAKPGKRAELKQEIRASVKRFSNSLTETTFTLRADTHDEYTFSGFFDLSPVLMYVLLAFIFLLIPAVNISGFISSMLDKRYEEIAIRKVYGASRWSIATRFLNENFRLVLIGGGLGLVLSIVLVYLFRTWLLGVSVAYTANLVLEWRMFFRPSIFIAALAGCIVFNLLSTFVPVWIASGRNIVDTLKS